MTKGKRKLIGFLVLIPSLFLGGLFLKDNFPVYARYVYLGLLVFVAGNSVEYFKDIIEYLKTRGK